ncbi:EF-hand domain-containing protein [Amycolatopsis sp. 195334CR]|uniref:EF-hand domain-containing protein n=1 Tax=Amycolatopsis sp. 195334CR TaxID=2814588 RepID=UPI001A8ED2B3|nr:EF-hand domain-containing protein [Amycolatopsis sp. 195334CR]MBN6037816.1 EF-hand domain-containing protein [Amycolatopsis sp. 195334CR]
MTTAVAQDRLTQRFEKWDTNGDGALELADFREEAHLIAEAFAKGEASPETRALMAAFTGLFDYLTSQAGARDSLTREQFRVVTERLIFEEGEAAFNRVMGPVVDGVIGMCDDNHDGHIDGDEFAIWLGALGVEQEEARTAFARIDSSGDGLLSTAELLAAVRDFHFGRLDLPLLG